MNPAQVMCVADAIFSRDNIHFTQLRVMKALTGIPWLAFNWISDEDKVFLAEKVSWAWKEATLTKQLFPKYKGLYGPETNFESITVGEFYWADKLFKLYLDTRKENFLNSFVEVLFRKKGEPFNNANLGQREKKIAKWKRPMKLSVLLWYQGCRDAFVKQNPDLFGGEGKPHPLGFYAVVSNLAPKFGSIDDAMNMRLKKFALEWKKAVHDNQPKK